MNKIKFLPNQNVLLQINFRTSTNTKLLGRVNSTKDLTKWWTIKSNNYVEIQSL